MKLAVSLVMLVAAAAYAAPAPEPTGPHPRIVLDADLKAAWHAQAGLEHGPVIGSIKLCANARDTHEHDAGVYRGIEWVKVLQACLVAWVATDNKDDATTAIRFMTALLDDQDKIGDGKGGDDIVRHDDGYPIRMVGPYTAIAYDWLHELLPPALRDRARSRWKSWLAWYRDKGYRNESPGTNYHAGYVFAASMMAIAQGGEAGGDGTKLWRDVVDTMWGRDMAVAFTDDGVLAGGDWPEGWQYGPLSVAELALGARALRGAGAKINSASWLDDLLKVHVYGLTPNDRVFPGGDTEEESSAYLAVSPLTLDAIALGDASPDDKRWARGELSRLQLVDVDWLLFDALAGVGDKPQLPPRASWPTWYVATAVRTIFARTTWNADAIWFVAKCAPTLDVDHRASDAGNFALSRGKDDVIVDPSPYGTQSTLTSNAPTIRSPQLPKNYQPGQAYWSTKTGFELLTQRASGVVAARCDYADQFKFQERASDIPEAVRDLVMIPSVDKKDAAVVVVDHADTGGDDRALYLRFRTPGTLVASGDNASATVGSTKLTIQSVAHSSGSPKIAKTALKDCFGETVDRGNCDAARIPVTDYRLELAGPTPRAVHVIGATAASTTITSAPLSGTDWAGVQLGGIRDASVIWRTKGTGPITYTAPPGMHVVLDAPEKDGKATVTAKPAGKDCEVAITAGGEVRSLPVIVTLDAACKITPDLEVEAGSTAPALTKPSSSHVRSPRGGCCGTQGGPSSPAMAGAIALLWMWPRRRKRLKKR
jgi:hypothetical protein